MTTPKKLTRNKTFFNENVDSDGSIQNKVLKQFGKSTSNRSFTGNEIHTKQVISLEEDQFSIASENEETKIIPQKRTESLFDLRLLPEAKRQETDTNIRTRKREQEKEWAPENLDMDFGLFSNKTYHHRKETPIDYNIFQDELPIIQRGFNTELIEVTNNEQKTVEHGYPKEIEIPFVPNDEHVVDFSSFNAFADLQSYEQVRILSKDECEFESIDDIDVLDVFVKNIFSDNNGLQLDIEDDTTDDDFDSLDSLDSNTLDIPFNDHVFDVEDYILSN